MAKTIGNPLSWTAQALGAAASHVGENVSHIGDDHSAVTLDDVTVNRISMEDLRLALGKGVEDLGETRTDAVFIALIYPVIGLLLAAVGFQASLLPLVFPLAAGFALLGPLAAVGLYEISRRRELGLPAGWSSAFEAASRPNFGAILALGLYLVAIFAAWIVVAHTIFVLTIGPEQPETVGGFLSDVFLTAPGWAMIVIGMGVGFLFAAAVLALSVVSFPLLLDRDVGVPTAVVTSIRVARKNPREVAAWGMIVATGLFLGSLPFFVGLIVVLPVLGHATWHLYRRAVTIRDAS